MTLGIEPEIEAPPVVEIPSEPTIEAAEITDEYGRFVAEPLERGFGATLGNALRRVLLNSLVGAAVNAIHVDGVQHEYSTMPDLREDISEFLLNIKGIRLRAHSDRPGTLRLEVQGPGQVTAGDIQPSADYEIVNPGLALANLDSASARLNVEFYVGGGKGYVPATPVEGMPIGVLPVDAIYTPITKVNYQVEKTRVGQMTDFEKLTIEIWTDGSKEPLGAMQEAAEILVDSFKQFAMMGREPDESAPGSSLYPDIPDEHYNLTIEKLGLSARTLNCLKRSKINKVGEILEKTHDELLRIKNFGGKSLTELNERLVALSIITESSLQDGEETLVEGLIEGAPGAEPGVVSVAAPGEPAEAESLRAGEPIKDLSALRALFTPKEAEDGEASLEAPEETPSEG